MALAAGDAAVLAAYLKGGDVRLVNRNAAANLKWFRIRDISREPLERLRAVFGGNVVEKCDVYYYSTALDMAKRIAKRLVNYPSARGISGLVGTANPTSGTRPSGNRGARTSTQ